MKKKSVFLSALLLIFIVSGASFADKGYHDVYNITSLKEIKKALKIDPMSFISMHLKDGEDVVINEDLTIINSVGGGRYFYLGDKKSASLTLAANKQIILKVSPKGYGVTLRVAGPFSSHENGRFNLHGSIVLNSGTGLELCELGRNRASNLTVLNTGTIFVKKGASLRIKEFEWDAASTGSIVLEEGSKLDAPEGLFIDRGVTLKGWLSVPVFGSEYAAERETASAGTYIYDSALKAYVKNGSPEGKKLFRETISIYDVDTDAKLKNAIDDIDTTNITLRDGASVAIREDIVFKDRSDKRNVRNHKTFTVGDEKNADLTIEAGTSIKITDAAKVFINSDFVEGSTVTLNGNILLEPKTSLFMTGKSLNFINNGSITAKSGSSLYLGESSEGYPDSSLILGGNGGTIILEEGVKVVAKENMFIDRGKSNIRFPEDYFVETEVKNDYDLISEVEVLVHKASDAPSSEYLTAGTYIYDAAKNAYIKQ